MEELLKLLDMHHTTSAEAMRRMTTDMRSLNDNVSTISTRLANTEATIEQFQINIKRFYEKDMGPLILAVNKNQEAIARIEIELAKLKTKIAIWGSIGVLAGSALVNMALSSLGAP